jgi:U3 small nucleolar RNA-associated protein 10
VNVNGWLLVWINRIPQPSWNSCRAWLFLLPVVRILIKIKFREHEDHSLPITTLAKRQIVALIIFVGHAWSQISSHAAYHPLNDGRDVDVQMLVAALLRLTIARTDALDPADINKAASLSLSMGLHVVPAADFLAAILRMIETADDRITIAALRLLSERLKKVSAKSRASVAATMTSITVHLQQILAATEEFSPLLEAILIGLQVISDTASTVEEGLLATIVPLLIQIGDRGITSPNLFKNLQSLTYVLRWLLLCFQLPTAFVCSVKLGPRVIPNLKSIILLCVRNLRQNAAGGPSSSQICPLSILPTFRINPAVLDLLSALLETLPSFWGPELLSVLQSCLELAAEGDGPLPSAVNDLLAHIPARIPSRTILPTLVLLWDDLSSSLIQDVGRLRRYILYPLITRASQGTTGKLGAYLNLLKNGVVAASRADALDHIRSLFKAFLEIFDLRGDLPLSKVRNASRMHLYSTVNTHQFIRMSPLSKMPVLRYSWNSLRSSTRHRSNLYSGGFTTGRSRPRMKQKSWTGALRSAEL